MRPLVSVITPAFNASRTIEQAIDSVQRQTFMNWEMIVVDDCSTDDTRAIVQKSSTSDRRIRLLRQVVNSGPALARNAALRASSGRYVSFLDSDDYWLPEKLDHQLRFMTSKKVALSYTLYRRFREEGAVGQLARLPHALTYSHLLKNTAIACLTVMVDTEQTGPIQFPEVRHEDYGLWLQLLNRGFVAHGLMEDLARYRVSNESVSGNKLKSAAWVWNIYRNVEKLSLPYATWCFLNYAWNAYKRNA